jgi:hypothetical protein
LSRTQSLRPSAHTRGPVRERLSRASPGFTFITESTLSSIDPATTVGLGIGQTSDSGCTLLASNTAATSGTVVSAEVEVGSYCISVYDVGNLTGSATYSLTVTHP